MNTQIHTEAETNIELTETGTEKAKPNNTTYRHKYKNISKEY